MSGPAKDTWDRHSCLSSKDGRQECLPHGVIAEVERLLTLARSRGASDLHLEPTAEGLSVRLRLDGVLQDVETLGRDLARPVIARLKFLADLLTYRSDIPQEGRLREEEMGTGSFSPPGEKVPVPISGEKEPVPVPETLSGRVSTFPTIHGERAVVRFFDRKCAAFELADLNFPPAVLDGLRRAVAATSGVVLLTGPAGSGKTTTLYALLNSIRGRSPLVLPGEKGVGGLHVITVEDPVEAVLPGVTQTQVNAAAGLTYAAALRSLLRQDPEVVMVGEIRDRETAEIVAQAGLTGHLVLSTLHGGDVATVIARLLEMGLEPYVITSALRAVLAMRLVRRLCERCRPAPSGCDACGHTGYAGRLPLVEFAEVTGGLKKLILACGDSDAFAQELARGGMRTLAERGIEMVEQGWTSRAELTRVLGPLEKQA